MEPDCEPIVNGSSLCCWAWLQAEPKGPPMLFCHTSSERASAAGMNAVA
jgi:hypothetical protein